MKRDSWPRRVLANSSSKDGARLVLIVLAEHANQDGHAWPSVATIAFLANIKERQVQRHLRRLCKAGELRIVTPGGGRNRPTKYELTVSWTTPFHEPAPRKNRREKRCHQLPGFSPHLRDLIQQSKRVSSTTPEVVNQPIEAQL